MDVQIGYYKTLKNIISYIFPHSCVSVGTDKDTV